MCKFKIFIVCLLVHSLQISVFAEIPELAQKAFMAMDKIEQSDWSYSCTMTEEGEVRTVQHNPLAESKWTLVSVNGKEPDAETQKKFQQEKRRDDHSDEDSDKNSNKDKFSDIADSDSWTLKSETDQEAIYTFRPAADDPDDAKIMRKLIGTMIFDKQSPHVKSFSLEAIKPFRPVLVAKILKMRIDLEFAEIRPGEFVMVREAQDVLVRAMGIKQHEKTEKKCSDFKRVVNSS